MENCFWSYTSILANVLYIWNLCKWWSSFPSMVSKHSRMALDSTLIPRLWFMESRTN